MAEIKRIVAFGCSFTYGLWLDCGPVKGDPFSRQNQHLGLGPEDKPSKLAWPQLLADRLGCDCENISAPGTGPRYVAAQVAAFDWQQGDHCVILWSYRHRHWIALPRNTGRHQRFWGKNWTGGLDEYADLVRKGYTNDDDREVDDFLAKKFVDYHLRVLGIPSTQYTVETEPTLDPRFDAGVEPLPWWPEHYYVDFAYDNMHFGVQGHHRMAERYLKTITRR